MRECGHRIRVQAVVNAAQYFQVSDRAISVDHRVYRHRPLDAVAHQVGRIGRIDFGERNRSGEFAAASQSDSAPQSERSSFLRLRSGSACSKSSSNTFSR